MRKHIRRVKAKYSKTVDGSRYAWAMNRKLRMYLDRQADCFASTLKQLVEAAEWQRKSDELDSRKP